MLARRSIGTLVVLTSCALPVLGQQLPAPSRTMYKCTNGKLVSYSDQPCLGAERLVVVPTRGVNKLSGQERIGKDVAREQRREMFAEGIKPLTGMNAAQFEVAVRRHRLGSTAQTECRQLDAILPQTEAVEAAADKSTRPAVQQHLFRLRKRYTELGC